MTYGVFQRETHLKLTMILDREFFNVLILSWGFMFTFSAFLTTSNIQVSIFIVHVFDSVVRNVIEDTKTAAKNSSVCELFYNYQFRITSLPYTCVHKILLVALFFRFDKYLEIFFKRFLFHWKMYFFFFFFFFFLIEHI